MADDGNLDPGLRAAVNQLVYRFLDLAWQVGWGTGHPAPLHTVISDDVG